MAAQRDDLPLSRYRVIDLTGRQGALCGRVLGDLGADVIKIEPPGGDPARAAGPFHHDTGHPDDSLSFWAYNTNKRSVVLGLERAEDRDRVRGLIAGADFVIESAPPGRLDGLGLGYAELSHGHEGLIMVSITPFGASGPYRGYAGGDLVSLAAGGLLYLCGPPDHRPVTIGVPQAYNQAGAQAAVGALIAHEHRRRTGLGQQVDVSVQEAVANALDWVQQYYDIRGVICKRGTTPGLKIHRNWIWRCKDGYVSWVWWVGAGWGRKNVPLVEWMAEEGLSPELRGVAWEEMSLYKLSQEQVDAWEAAFAAFFARRTVGELVAGALERRLLLYPVNSPRGVVENRQLAHRGLFADLTPSGKDAPIKYPRPPVRSPTPLAAVTRPAPRVGEHSSEVLSEPTRTPEPPRLDAGGAQGGALEGLKVADFTWLVAGPALAKNLALFGATVVKVEFSGRLDGTRQSGPFSGKPTFNSSGHFANHNAGKLSLGIDLNDPRGLAAARRLVEWADVVIENFTPGVMERWGLGYEGIAAINPKAVVLSSSFQGQDGPDAKQAGYASLLHALSGINQINGWPDLPPTDIADAYGDLIGVWYGLAALMAALDRRRDTGRGAYIDLSQFDAAVHFVAPVILDYLVNGRSAGPQGNRSAEAAPHGVYACADDPAAAPEAADRWCAIAVYTDEQWRALVEVMGRPAWAGDRRFASKTERRRNPDALDTLIDEWTRPRKAEEVMRLLQGAGVPAAVAATAYDLFRDPQLRHREHFVLLDHPEMGRRAYDAPSFRLSRTPHELRRAPLLGEHTHFIATELLGYTDEEFATLLAEGVFEQES